VEVVMPPRPEIIRFQDINDDDDDNEYSPPPPTPPQRRKTATVAETEDIEVFKKLCERCRKGKRLCEVDEVGAACLGCKARKYGCGHTGRTDLETRWVAWPVSPAESEVEIVDKQKGKKRKAESPVPAKKKAMVKMVKVEKPRNMRTKEKEKAEKPKASGSKPQARRRVARKSSVVLDIAEDDDAMEVDEGSDEGAPQPKRVRATKGKCPTFFYFILYLSFVRRHCRAQQASCCARGTNEGLR